MGATREKVRKWRGERMNLDLAVDILVQQSRKWTDVPDGTPGPRRRIDDQRMSAAALAASRSIPDVEAEISNL
jgi:hypothetical protein